MIIINNKIKIYRAIKNVSQQELADAIGVTQQTIGRIEKLGTTNLVTAKKIANYFGVRIEDIFLIKNTIYNVKSEEKNKVKNI